MASNNSSDLDLPSTVGASDNSDSSFINHTSTDSDSEDSRPKKKAKSKRGEKGAEKQDGDDDSFGSSEGELFVDDEGDLFDGALITRGGDGQGETAMIVHNPEHARMFEELKQVARMRISENTRKQYNRTNAAYVQWLFVNKKDFIKADFLDLFTEAFFQEEELGLIRVVNRVVVDEELNPIDFSKHTSDIFLLTFYLLKTT